MTQPSERPSLQGLEHEDPRHEGSLDELRRELTELRASRARAFAAEHDVRRAVERDLHDGPQQQLVALGVKLQLARQLMDTDLAGLGELLDEIGRDAHEALDDVRRLAWRVYPSLLLDQGLGDALRTAATNVAVRTHVEVVQPIGRYPRDVEAAIYFTCLEVLHAAGAHTDSGGRVTVRLRQVRDELLLDVCVEATEPGPWEEPDLAGAGDRVGAVGGRLIVTSEDGRRVCVSAAIPVDR